MLTPQTPGHGKSLKRNSKHIREQAGGESGDDITDVLDRHVHGHSSGVRGRSRLGVAATGTGASAGGSRLGGLTRSGRGGRRGIDLGAVHGGFGTAFVIVGGGAVSLAGGVVGVTLDAVLE